MQLESHASRDPGGWNAQIEMARRESLRYGSEEFQDKKTGGLLANLAKKILNGNPTPASSPTISSGPPSKPGSKSKLLKLPKEKIL